MRRGLFFLLLLLPLSPVRAQMDTVRIATYNLLHYGLPQANRYTLKNAHLQPILAAIRPSLICFNEIDTVLPGAMDTLLKVMPFVMQHGARHNNTGTDILDALYWRTGKFRLLRDSVIGSYYRDIVAYDLFFDDPLLGSAHDTVFLKVITVHLKSSNTVADRNIRDVETQQVEAYLTALHDTMNVVLLGDLNLYRSSEAAYQHLIAPADPLARLNDPAGRPGVWDDNALFADVHTQSTRTAQLADQGASGGLDSRFDFVLVSDAMLYGWRGMTYLPGSYTVFGNDGQHFNKALTDTPAHPTLPQSLIQALYSSSDHLPVYADFAVSPPPRSAAGTGGRITALLKDRMTISNPFNDGIEYRLSGANEILHYRLLTVEGAVIQSGRIFPGNGTLPVSGDLPAGLYLLQVQDRGGNRAIWKLRRQP